MENLCIVKNLNFSYDTKNILLKNINLEIKKGEFLAIIGANGTGKTTLLRVLLEELKPQSGKIIFNTKKISYVSQAQDKTIQNFPATVLEVVLMNLTKEIGIFKFANKKHKEKAMKALELVNMKDYSKRLISELSGGQRQRVMIAKAIVQNPEFLILDEPTTGLDKKSVEDLFEILTELNNKYKMTILMISHDLFRVRTWCNKIYLLEEGELYVTV